MKPACSLMGTFTEEGVGPGNPPVWPLRSQSPRHLSFILYLHHHITCVTGCSTSSRTEDTQFCTDLYVGHPLTASPPPPHPFPSLRLLPLSQVTGDRASSEQGVPWLPTTTSSTPIWISFFYPANNLHKLVETCLKGMKGLCQWPSVSMAEARQWVQKLLVINLTAAQHKPHFLRKKADTSAFSFSSVKL